MRLHTTRPKQTQVSLDDCFGGVEKGGEGGGGGGVGKLPLYGP